MYYHDKMTINAATFGDVSTSDLGLISSTQDSSSARNIFRNVHDVSHELISKRVFSDI